MRKTAIVRSVFLVVLRIARALATIAAVGSAVLALRLAAGPIDLTRDLPFAIRRLEQMGALPPGAALSVGAAAVAWAAGPTGPALTLRDARFAAGDGSLDAAAKGFEVALDAASLLHGVVAPTIVRLDGAAVSVILPEASEQPPTGEPADAAAANSSAEVTETLTRLIGPQGPLGSLRRVAIHDSVASVVRRGAPPIQLQAPRVDLDFAASGEDAAGRGEASIEAAGRTAALSIAVAAWEGERAIDVVVRDLWPSAFADYAAAASILDVPLSGRITARLPNAAAAPRVTFNLAGGEGVVVMTPALAARMGAEELAQTVPLRSALLQGEADVAAGAARITNLDVSFGDDAAIRLPTSPEATMPIRRISGRAVLDGERLDVENLEFALGGPTVTIDRAVVSGFSATPTIEATAGLRNLDARELARYWPASAAPGGREWVTKHVLDGRVPSGWMKISLGPDASGTFTATAFEAGFDVEGATIDYLPPMPRVTGASARATADLSSLKFAIASGEAAGLTVRGGEVAIVNLEADPPSLDVDLTIAGPASSVVEILSGPPLGVTEGTGVSPRNVRGAVQARVQMAFPLYDDIEFEQIDLDVDARTANLGVAGLFDVVDIASAALSFRVTEMGLHAQGPLIVAGLPGVLNWDEVFAKDAPIGRRVTFAVTDAPVAPKLRDRRIVEGMAQYVPSGRFAGTVSYVEGAGKPAALDVDLDLKQAEVVVRRADWRKPIGQPATATAKLSMVGGNFVGPQSFEFAGGGAIARGEAEIDEAGRLQAASVDRLHFGRTDLTGSLTVLDGGEWNVEVRGSGLDFDVFFARDGAGAGGGASGGMDQLPPNLTFAADIGSVWLGDVTLSPLVATVVRRDGRWSQVQIVGDSPNQDRVQVTIAPSGPQRRRAVVEIENLGALLAGAGVYGDMTGGRLRAEGEIVDGPISPTITGKVRVRSFRMVRAPVLARLLNILALSGIREALTGQGIGFSLLEASIVERNGVIRIAEGHVHGLSLGMTAQGHINLNDDTIDLQGVVVPFYWANNLIANLPLLGEWLTGGSPNGGVFSAAYTMKGPLSDPDVSVNAFSAVLPSVLRWVVEVVQGWLMGRADGTLEADEEFWAH